MAALTFVICAKALALGVVTMPVPGAVPVPDAVAGAVTGTTASTVGKPCVGARVCGMDGGMY